MILLTSTSDLLRVTTSSAAAVKVHASHVDRSGATITPGRLNTAIASATTTTIVASPAASTDRTVKFVSIYNDDASLSVTVTVLHTDGTTAVDMWSATLAPQQGLQYDEGAGWSAPEGIYATAAQGALADTAVQPADDAADLGSGSAADGYVLTADGAGGAAWEAASGGGGTPGGTDTQVQFNDGGAFGGDSGFTFDKTNNTLGLGGGTITASDPIIDMAQTWNNGAVAFTAVKASVTDTASAAGSLLMDLQAGGVSRFSVGKGAGAIFATNLVEQRNGTAAQAFNVYNTYTDASNYERGVMKWATNVLEIGTEALGTGTARIVQINAGGATNLIKATGGAVNAVSLCGDRFSLSTSASAIVLNGQEHFYFSGNAAVPVFRVRSGSQFGFSSTTSASGVADTGVARNAAGVAKITNGSTGTGQLIFIVPTTDPGITGALWNNAGTLAISA